MSTGRSGRSQESQPLRWPSIVVVSSLPLAIVFILYVLEVPFGRPGVQVYPYSPYVASRVVTAAVPLATIGIVAAAAGRTTAARRLWSGDTAGDTRHPETGFPTR